jgi:hypothetical protein
MASQAVAVSLYLDGRLLARSWELARPGPLAAQAMLLGASLLQSPDYGTPPGPDDLARVTVGVSVFYRFREIKDEGDLSGGDGVVVINGFKEGVAVPGDVDSPGDPTAILSFASEVAGMRPGAWMLPGTSLLAAQVDEERLDK